MCVELGRSADCVVCTYLIIHGQFIFIIIVVAGGHYGFNGREESMDFNFVMLYNKMYFWTIYQSLSLFIPISGFHK